MSSRALRRLEKEKLARETPSPDESEESEDEVRPKAFNAFALLGGEEDEASDPEEIEEPKSKPVPISLPSKKSKKKKNKKNAKKVVAVESDEDSDGDLDKILEEIRAKDNAKLGIKNANTQGDDDVYDFEEEYNDVNEPVLHYDSNFKYFTTKRLQQSIPHLKIDVKDLDPDKEFRNLFGKLSLDDEEDTGGAPPEVLQQIKKLTKLVRGWGGKDKRGFPGSTRKLVLTKIRNDWVPTTRKSIQMEEINADEFVKYYDYKEDELSIEELSLKVKREQLLGVKYFKYTRFNGSEEMVANSRFYASVVITPDIDSLIHLLQRFPYHIETILQVATILVAQGQKANSDGLVERGLFVFDRGFKQNFEIGNGLVRLPFECYLNRQFYLTLFRYITILSEKNTYLTALTYCKLLLSLSPAEDPYGVRYFIDFYAILSGEYEFLISFAKSTLCQTYDKWLTPGIIYSVVLSYLYLDDIENAKLWLRKAYEKFPFTGYRLLETIGLPYKLPIKEKDLPINDEIELATETYIVRTKAMWEDESKRQFLHDNLLELMSSTKISPVLLKNAKEFKEIPINLIRFAILSGESKVMAKVPRQLWANQEIYDYDVLPPKMAEGETELGFIGDDTKIVDALIDYIDDNIVSSILQNAGQQELFQDMGQLHADEGN